MTTFLGEYQCSVDAKNRIMLPSALKRQMTPAAQDRLAVRKDTFSSCLTLFPWDEWELQIKKLRSKLNLNIREHNDYYRDFFQNTAELVLDNTNRMLLPKNLMVLVEIKKEVVLFGLGDKIEIWAKEKFVSGRQDEDKFAAQTEKLLGSLNDFNTIND